MHIFLHKRINNGHVMRYAYDMHAAIFVLTSETAPEAV